MGETSECHVMSRRMKYATSGAVWFNLLTMAISNNFLSPGLVELKNKYNTDISTISVVFTVYQVTYLLGAIICGTIYNYFNRQLTVIAILIINGTAIICIPHCSTLYLFFCAGAGMGFAAGGYDTAQFVWIIEMWQNHAGPYIQTQHFFYAFGTFLSPLVLAPFLSVESPDDAHNTTTPINSNSSEDAVKLLTVPFSCGGSLTILGALYFLILYIYDPYVPPAKVGGTHEGDYDPLLVSEDYDDSEERCLVSPDRSPTPRSPTFKQKCPVWHRFAVIFVAAVILGTYVGMEYCSLQFIPTFAHFLELNLSQQKAAFILSALTAAYMVGRASGILIITRVKPCRILCGNLFIILCGTITILSFGNESLPALLAGSITIGAGFSTFFPTFYAFIQSKVNVTNTVGTILVVATGSIAAMFPWVLGQFIAKFPMALMYTNLFSLSLISLCLIALQALTSRVTSIFATLKIV